VSSGTGVQEMGASTRATALRHEASSGSEVTVAGSASPIQRRPPRERHGGRARSSATRRAPAPAAAPTGSARRRAAAPRRRHRALAPCSPQAGRVPRRRAGCDRGKILTSHHAPGPSVPRPVRRRELLPARTGGETQDPTRP
jgi:hypothetical protein